MKDLVCCKAIVYRQYIIDSDPRPIHEDCSHHIRTSITTRAQCQTRAFQEAISALDSRASEVPIPHNPGARFAVVIVVVIIVVVIVIIIVVVVVVIVIIIDTVVIAAVRTEFGT